LDSRHNTWRLHRLMLGGRSVRMRLDTCRGFNGGRRKRSRHCNTRRAAICRHRRRRFTALNRQPITFVIIGIDSKFSQTQGRDSSRGTGLVFAGRTGR
jgi:hypothetical protein